MEKNKKINKQDVSNQKIKISNHEAQISFAVIEKQNI